MCKLFMLSSPNFQKIIGQGIVLRAVQHLFHRFLLLKRDSPQRMGRFREDDGLLTIALEIDLFGVAGQRHIAAVGCTFSVVRAQ